ncbi:agmatinase [Methylotenera sp.]|nr:agmatinase [Methylotenera sp.]MDO9392773.1 agmatinase [Methylotenera sp.]MDP2070128.1 agmatinase [Methylotenera sp.]MDP2229791.1 agmatinase [Methylotenera sp.]MDP3006567.1 agmatinase [Methylotenera sp.]MDP3140444.1 agmatinase [Methylotenera sp.]
MKHAFPYAVTGGFLGLPITPAEIVDKSAISTFAVAGIAWDGCVTNRPGARFGPNAIRQASHMLCGDDHPLFDVSPVKHTVDLGNLMLPNTSLEAMRAALAPQASRLITQHTMVWLGGDHSITLPLLRAYHAHYQQPLACIHFDAHCDTWESHFGEPSGHGTWVYEAITEGLVDPKTFIQIGIRSSGERAAREFVNDQGGRIFTARELRGKDGAGLQSVIDEVRQRMMEAGNPPLYLTFDIDAFDPAFAPGTGTPEVGGLTTAQAMTLLEAWHDLNWVGMDCVEVSPPYDHAELTSNAAATLIWTWLCGQIAAKK